MEYCPECGTEARTDVTYCPGCGTDLTEYRQWSPSADAGHDADGRADTHDAGGDGTEPAPDESSAATATDDGSAPVDRSDDGSAPVDRSADSDPSDATGDADGHDAPRHDEGRSEPDDPRPDEPPRDDPDGGARRDDASRAANDARPGERSEPDSEARGPPDAGQSPGGQPADQRREDQRQPAEDRGREPESPAGNRRQEQPTDRHQQSGQGRPADRPPRQDGHSRPNAQGGQPDPRGRQQQGRGGQPAPNAGGGQPAGGRGRANQPQGGRQAADPQPAGGAAGHGGAAGRGGANQWQGDAAGGTAAGQGAAVDRGPSLTEQVKALPFGRSAAVGAGLYVATYVVTYLAFLADVLVLNASKHELSASNLMPLSPVENATASMWQFVGWLFYEGQMVTLERTRVVETGGQQESTTEAISFFEASYWTQFQGISDTVVTAGLYTAVPALVLVAGSALFVKYRSGGADDSPGGMLLGASVVVGYAVLAAAGSLLFSASHSEFESAATAELSTTPVLMEAILFPAAFALVAGAVGGIVAGSLGDDDAPPAQPRQ